jgi:general stress protein YciG
VAGTLEGGRKAAAMNKQLHGADFYKRIGAKGGRNGNTGGFAANRELARKAGAIGGAKSKRGPNKRPVPDSMKVKSVAVPTQKPSRYEQLVRAIRASGSGRKAL